MGNNRPGVAVQRERIKEALRELLGTKSVDELAVDTLAKHAGMSRATFYRCFSSVEEVMMILYDDFEERARERLLISLPQADVLGEWIDQLVEMVLRDAIEMGPLLRALFREELRPGSAAAERQRLRIDRQIELISRWWEETLHLPVSEGIIHAFILLLQAGGLHVAAEASEQELEKLRAGIGVVIRATIERYQSDHS